MEIIERKTGKRCEMGKCRNRAGIEVKVERMGIRSTLYICGDCAKALYEALGTQIVPKSIETLRGLHASRKGSGTPQNNQK